MMNAKKIINRLLFAILIFGLFLIPTAIFNLSSLRCYLTNVRYLAIFGTLSLIFSFTFRRKNELGSLLTLMCFFVIFSLIMVASYSINQDKEKVKWNSPTDSFIIDFVVGHKGHIYMEASVNDTTGLFLFDTGAGISIVNEKFVTDKKMKVRPVTITDANGIQQTKDLYKVNKFVLGDFEIKRLQVYPKDSITWTDPKGVFYKQDSIIGVIGNNIISKFIWDFDLINRKVKISKSKKYCNTIPDSLSVPLTWNNDNKDIPVKINGAERKLTFDFGAYEALSISDSIPNIFSGGKGRITGGNSIGALNHLDSTKRKENSMDFVAVELGVYKFKEVWCTENDHSNLLGLPFIWAFERVVVDYLHDKAYFINKNSNSDGRGKVNYNRYNVWCNAYELKDAVNTVSISNSKRQNGRYIFYGNSTWYLVTSGMDSIFYRDSLLLPNGQIEYGPATWIPDN